MSDASHRDSSRAAPTAAHFPNANRRRFLTAFGAGAAGVVSAPVLAVPAAVVEAADAKPASQGYRETEHVRSYYASTRL